MKIRSYGSKRDDNEPDIIEELKRAGCEVIQQNEPTDLLVGVAGRWFPVEVKGPKGKLTGKQKEFFSKCSDSCLPAIILRTRTEARAWVQSLMA